MCPLQRRLFMKQPLDPLNLNDEPFTELEGILAQKQMQMEQVRIEHEDQIVVIEEQKAERLAEIETEEAVQLEKLRQGGNSKGFFRPKKWPQYRPQNQPKIAIEKDTLINFQFRMFWAAFQAVFTTVAPFLIQ